MSGQMTPGDALEFASWTGLPLEEAGDILVDALEHGDYHSAESISGSPVVLVRSESGRLIGRRYARGPNGWRCVAATSGDSK
jgi:hypothetical protein